MSLLEFYQYLKIGRPDVIIPDSVLSTHTGHFDVFKRIGACSLNTAPYIRKDFYKITLVIGKGILNYPKQKIIVDGSALIINNPVTPYSWETTSPVQSGYFCLFTENFIKSRTEAFKDSLLAKIQDTPVLLLNEIQVQEATLLFEKMMSVMEEDYTFKNELLQTYLRLLIHEALKIQPKDNNGKSHNASTRISNLFFELLENQFPIHSTDNILELRTANDFAERLNIHVNHLNHAVKEFTGKTTSEHIAARIADEAIALLRHTEWNVSEIGYCLGFEYPANFNIFFKRQTMASPRSFRQVHYPALKQV
ncbi:MAG TPA: helix-turn-helix domain-containing protein [Pedobacter sp.]